jgi:uncharacterized protein with PIN domain
MESNVTLAVNALSLLLGSSLLVAVLNNSRKASVEHKKLVAEASKSVLNRVEMYYRIRRRTKNQDDVIAIRNMFHQVQEENEFYKALLISESKWHGERYVLYISAIQRLTAKETQEAWKQRPFGPDAEIKPEQRPNMQRINELSLQFAKDSRRLMNPILRIWMRIRDSWLVKKFWKIKAYEP